MATIYKYYKDSDFYYKVNPYGTFYRWNTKNNQWVLAEGNYWNDYDWSIWSNDEVSELEVVVRLGKL